MSKLFVFEGHTTIKRKFKIDIVSNSYEAAEEQARTYLEDTENGLNYDMASDELDIEIDSYDEESLFFQD